MTTAGSNLILESEGISEEFFTLLWSKDEFNFGPNISIPDTIIYKQGSPTCWYFTTLAGTIKRKNRQNLVSSRIEEALTSHVLGYDVLATFISFPVHSGLKSNEKRSSIVEYLDKKSLYDFLYQSDKRKSGILQRFIEPKGTKNDIIRAIWSPKICLLERTENIHHLHDQRFGLYERCVTLEGPDYFSVASSVRGAVLAGQMQKICETVVSHISEVTYERMQISRVVVNLKVDSRDKLWLLFTTSIRCESDSQRDMSRGHQRIKINLNSFYTLPDTVNLNPVKSYEDIAVRKPKTRIWCVSCSEETLDHLRHPVAYKGIVKHYEHVICLLIEGSAQYSPAASQTSRAPRSVFVAWPPDKQIVSSAGGVGFGCLDLSKNGTSNSSKLAMIDVFDDEHCLMIPPILRHLHPKLDSASYDRCCKDPLFLAKTVTVCESCFLVYADFITMLLRMGPNVTNYLKSDMASTLRANESCTSTRPSSADWRAMSSVHRSHSNVSDALQSGPSIATFHPSESHVNAKNSAIGMRNSEIGTKPSVPAAIRRGEDTGQTHSLLNSFTGGVINRGCDSSGSSSVRSRKGTRSADGTATASASPSASRATRTALEKERSFFDENTKNSQMSAHHPFMHLITAQERVSARTSYFITLYSTLIPTFCDLFFFS